MFISSSSTSLACSSHNLYSKMYIEILIYSRSGPSVPYKQFSAKRREVRSASNVKVQKSLDR